MAIISCPECGHEVSDLAASCPNCGVAIHDNIVACPDCGKVLLKDTVQCPNCSCVLEPEKEPAHRKSKARKASRQTKPSRNIGDNPNVKKVWGWIIGGTLLVLIVAGCALFFAHQQEQTASEIEYAELQNNFDINRLEAYIKAHPDSPYNDELALRIKSLEQMENRWMFIWLSSDKADYQAFIDSFKVGPRVEDAKLAIDSLDWLEAATTNTKDSYTAYLAAHPKGRWASEGQAMVQNVNNTTPTPEERSVVSRAVLGYMDRVNTGTATGAGAQLYERLQAEGGSVYEVGAVSVRRVPAAGGKVSFRASVTASHIGAGGKTYSVNFTVQPDGAITAVSYSLVEPEPVEAPAESDVARTAEPETQE